jgi:hypothetical protein
MLLLVLPLVYFHLFWACVFLAICISLAVEVELYFP